MKRLIPLFALVVLFVSGCKVGCAVQEKVVDVAAGVVTTGLSCKGTAAVKADLNAFCDKQTHLCDAKAGAIADLACPVLAQWAKVVLVPAVGSGLPVAWKCDPAASVSNVVDMLTVGCRQLPF